MASGGIDSPREGNLPDLNVGVLFKNPFELDGAVFFTTKKPNADNVLPGITKLAVEIKNPDFG